jgi:uncharacterized protein
LINRVHQSHIRDPIHGDIFLSPEVRALIDTHSFQRLRYISQLATCHFAFPSATHTRFSHSIGAYHLATTLVKRLNEIYPGTMSELDQKLVCYGALLHDVGHPPFSHMLETPDVFATYASHEEWGKRLLLDEEGDLNQALRSVVGKEGIQRLIDIMEGRVNLPALHDIVSSQLDVDRLDYLVRDQHFTGVEVGGFDTSRLFRSIRLREDGHLAISRDGLPIVESYLITRWHMYYLVYFHRISVLTQVYITKALQRAKTLYQKGNLELNPALHDILINEQLTPAKYVKLTDAPIMMALFEWSTHTDKVLSVLAQRVVSRSAFHRRISGYPLKISMARRLLPQLRAIISEAGFQPELDLILARTQKRGYFPYDSGILLEDGSDVRERSKIIQALESKIDEVMIFVPPECVDLCVAHIEVELNASKLGE